MVNNNNIGDSVYVVDKRELTVTHHKIVATHKNSVIELDDGKKFCTTTGTLVNRYFKKYSKYLSRQPEIHRFLLLKEESTAIKFSRDFNKIIEYMEDVDILKYQIDILIATFLEKYNMTASFELKKQTILNLIDKYCND